MDFIISLIIFFLLIGILVFVHELGHFLVAKKVGVVVQEFAFGFGPRLFSRKYKGTEYRFNAIPLGGYVKMLGDQDASSFARFTAKAYAKEDKDYALKLLKSNKLDPAKTAFVKIEEFVKSQKDELSKENYAKLENYYVYEYIPNHPGNYDNKRIRSRIAIVIAGVVVNFFFGALIFYLLFQFTGYSTDVVKLGDPKLIGVTEFSPPIIYEMYGQGDEELEGSVIMRINGEVVTTEDQFNSILVENYDQPLAITAFARGGYITKSVVLNGDGINSNFDENVRDKVVIVSLSEESAAAKAGVEVGDVITSFSGNEVEDVDQVLELLQENKGKSVKLEIINSRGEFVTLTVDLPNNEEGPILGAGLSENTGLLENALRISYEDNKLLSGILHAFNMTTYTVTGFGELIGQSVEQGNIAPVSQGVSSILGVADVVYSLVQVRDFQNILNLAGLISVTLAFMNILPIPLFDGGNLVFLIIERIRRRPLSAEKQEKIGMYTFYILIVLLVVIMVKDVLQYDWIGRLLNLIRGIFSPQ